MEDQKANIIACVVIITLIILMIISRVCLELSRPFFLIAGADSAVILTVFGWLIIRRRYQNRSELVKSQILSEGTELRLEYSFLRKVAGLPIKFRYEEIQEATDNFQALLGQGASASVFKGILNDGTAVAVKRIEAEERGDKEFRSEVAAVASVQHVNLVRLLGYCTVPCGKRYLVYEFIPNGSLDCWIFNRRHSKRRGCLPWDLRYRVAIDVAKALSYLHHDCRSRILHLDVKPENILLNENYRGIVSDFGLSRLMGKDESSVITNIRGTRGYLAPEWLLENGISEKCDVYSYGMVLLEMVGGQRNVSSVQIESSRSRRKWQYFPRIVQQKMREGKLMEVVDQRLIERGGIDEKEVRRLVNVAFWCIQQKACARPSMARVVEMLEGRTSVEEPPDPQMVVLDLLSIDEEDGPTRDDTTIISPINYIAAFTPDHVDNSQSSTLSYSYTMSTISPR